MKNTSTSKINGNLISALLKPRLPNAHKGNFGHVLLIAGSKGKGGAALLASKACLRSGVGRLTTHIPRFLELAHLTFVPEAMIHVDENEQYCTEIQDCNLFDAIGIGPGLGEHPKTLEVLLFLLQSYEGPMVLDADALNLISTHHLQHLLSNRCILTPHPGEFERLTGQTYKEDNRERQVSAFSQEYRVNTVLKGDSTLVSNERGEVYKNTTGNPGLAKAGSGDVLTGMILAFLGQGYEPTAAAHLGVYLHGRAADLAVQQIHERSLLASDTIAFISNAISSVTD
jgi:NAD(P)H-hydrate epimerase